MTAFVIEDEDTLDDDFDFDRTSGQLVITFPNTSQVIAADVVQQQLWVAAKSGGVPSDLRGQRLGVSRQRATLGKKAASFKNSGGRQHSLQSPNPARATALATSAGAVPPR